MVVERAPGEGTRGTVGEEVVATLWGAGLTWRDPRRAQSREGGAQGVAAKKRRNLVREDMGGLLRPDKDCLSEGKGNE